MSTGTTAHGLLSHNTWCSQVYVCMYILLAHDLETRKCVKCVSRDTHRTTHPPGHPHHPTPRTSIIDAWTRGTRHERVFVYVCVREKETEHGTRAQASARDTAYRERIWTAAAGGGGAWVCICAAYTLVDRRDARAKLCLHVDDGRTTRRQRGCGLAARPGHGAVCFVFRSGFARESHSKEGSGKIGKKNNRCLMENKETKSL